MIEVKVEGLREIEKAFGELTHLTARGVARRALKKGGQVVADEMIALAPEAEGKLKESITVGTKLNTRQRRGRKKQADVEMFVGTNDPAGIQQEYGNIIHQAQPFARPAWDSKQMECLNVTVKYLKIELDKSIQRARRKAMKK